MPVHDWTRVDAGTFHAFHLSWIAEIQRALNRNVLPPDYYAQAEQIVGPIGPDVLALQRPGGSRPDHDGRLAVATLPEFGYRASAADAGYAARQRTVGVRHHGDHRVVALIEIVSQGNKNNRNGFRAFLNKAVECFDLGLHLLIADLFPPGPRDPRGIHSAIWAEVTDDVFEPPQGRPLTLVSYFAGVVREAFIEPTAVGSILRDMPLFLEPDLFVNVPMEATYVEAFRDVPKYWQEVLESGLN